MKFLKFSVRKFLKSFLYAFRGIREVFFQEQNFKVHCLMGLLALLLGWLLKISGVEWCFLLVVIALVLAAEMLNTALEQLCNLTQPNPDETVRIIKDISAGMVLVCAIGALGVGVVIFLPKLLKFIFTI